MGQKIKNGESLEAVTHTHTHTYILVNEFLNNSTYFIKIGFNFIEKIIKDELYKKYSLSFLCSKRGDGYR